MSASLAMQAAVQDEARELSRLLIHARVRAGVLEGALEDALSFVERFEDVRDGDYGQPEPNEAMQVACLLRAALATGAGQ